MLEKYAVLLGGGLNHRYGLDDGVFIKSNHSAIAGGLTAAIKSAREKIGHVHKIAAGVANKSEASEAIEAGATVIVLDDLRPAEVRDLINETRGLSPDTTFEVSGSVTLDNVREYGESGADLIRVPALTQSVRAMDITFQMQPG